MFPPYVVKAFEPIRDNADEHEYYGAWNSLLNAVFPITEGYIITPQLPDLQFNTGERDIVDYTVLFIVSKNSTTIFFVQLKAPRSLSWRYVRNKTSKQMRKRLEQLYETFVSEIHGVCAFGTRVAFYGLNKDDNLIKPTPAADSTSGFLSDTAPEEWWRWDILKEDGYIQFMQVVEAAKTLASK